MKDVRQGVRAANRTTHDRPPALRRDSKAIRAWTREVADAIAFATVER